MKLTKHMGVDNNGNRLVLAYALLPESTTHTLVCSIDRVPDKLKEEILILLATNEGQAATNLADVLSRHMYSDSGKSIFVVLHESGFLQSVPIADVTMTPAPSIKLPLEMVLVESGILQRAAVENVDEKFNPHRFNSEAATFGEAAGVARNLLLEADMLENEARAKREKAYQYAPSLRPVDAAPEVSDALMNIQSEQAE